MTVNNKTMNADERSVAVAESPERELPAGWRWARLGEVCELNPPMRSRQVLTPETEVSFVPMAAVDERSGTIRDRLGRPLAEVRKGYTSFEEGDVLFAKITPCMQNGKHAIAEGLLGGIGFGTTEFHVIRPSSVVLAEWIHLFIRPPAILLEATAYFTGSVGQQRVPDSFLRELGIPLPPVEEQRRIVGILKEQLGEVERARAACEAQLEAARALPDAYLREILGSQEARDWPKSPIGDVCEIVARQVDPKLAEHKHLPHVSAEDIESVFCRMGPLRSAAEDEMISGKYLFSPGDVLYSKLRPYLRKVAVPDFAGLCSADMYPIRVKPEFLRSRFLAWVLVSEEFTRYADSESRRARMPKLNREQLFAWKMPLPSLEEQEEVSRFLDRSIDRAISIARELDQQRQIIIELPTRVLNRAFRGEL